MLGEQCVVVPEGTTVIEHAAFRGQRQIKEVQLPESLEEIGCLAFSCTSLRSVRLPRRCVRMGEFALRTGPETIPGADRAYRSTIERVEVDPGNSAFCVSGSVLCRRLESGALEALFCPGSCDAVSLGNDIAQVARTTFDGTYRIGTLRFREGLVLEEGAGIAPRAECGRVVIDLLQPEAGAASVQLEMPARELQRSVLAATVGVERPSARAFCAAYDAAVLREEDRLRQARLMVARLAAPIYLSAANRNVFREVIARDMNALAIHFGARGYWKGFNDMAEAGILDAEKIADLCNMLSARGDSATSAYLLKLRRERFGCEVFAYEL